MSVSDDTNGQAHAILLCSEAAGLRFVKLWDFVDTGLVEFAKDTDFEKAQWE